MTQRCRVCAHVQVQEINAALGSTSVLQLASRFGLTRDGLMRHRDRHLHTAPEPEPEPLPEPTLLPRPGGTTRIYRQHRESPSAREAFLEAYRTSGNVTHSAAIAGVTRGMVLRWREHDDAFNAAFNQAEIEAVELLEAEARERATKGTRLLRRVIRGGRLIEEVEEWRPSDAMLIKLLQALRPEKYGDKLSVTATTTVKTIDSEAWESV
jgi:hypothetical protein